MDNCEQNLHMRQITCEAVTSAEVGVGRRATIGAPDIPSLCGTWELPGGRDIPLKNGFGIDDFTGFV